MHEDINELKELLCEALYYVDDSAFVFGHKEADDLAKRIREYLARLDQQPTAKAGD